jgi:hypothetical protein
MSDYLSILLCYLICLHVKVMVNVVCQIIFLYHCVTLFVYMQRKKRMSDFFSIQLFDI